MGESTELVRFSALVRSMRTAQRKYFEEGRSQEWLRVSRELERKVDRALRWIADHRQGQLFPESPGPGEGAYPPRRSPRGKGGCHGE